MTDLCFYNVNHDYVLHLKEMEIKHRGFSRVPDIEYGASRKEKFLCGIVLQVQECNYFVPVSSYKQSKPDNFLIKADNDAIVSSLRFNYMFPVPLNQVKVKDFSEILDKQYRSLVAQELKYCRKNALIIQKTAERTYKRVLLGKNPGLVYNSCDFLLLEKACKNYSILVQSENSL